MSEAGAARPVPLFHEKRGSGMPIIGIHGFGASTYAWHDLAPSLSEGHELFLIDLKGFGRSPNPEDGRYSLRDQSDLVVQFAVEHNLRDITLIGHSLGGGVALISALRRPDLVSALILIDAMAYDQPQPLLAKILRTPILGAVIMRIFPVEFQVREILKRSYYRDDRISDAQVAAYAEPLRSAGGRYAVRETLRDVVPANVDELTSQYRTIRIPTLIIWGREDQLVPLPYGERLHADIAGSQLVVLDDTGHMPGEETPQPVIAAIREFLAAPR